MKDKKFNYVRIISSPHVVKVAPGSLLLWGLWLWWYYDNEMNQQSSLVAHYNSAKLLLNVIHFFFSLQQCETKPVSQSYESHCIVADGWKLMLVCFVLVHAWEFIISGSQLKIEKFDILQWGPIKLDTGSSLANLSQWFLQPSYLSFIFTWGLGGGRWDGRCWTNREEFIKLLFAQTWDIW